MSMTRTVERAGTRGYAHLVELHVPLARVWHALIDPRLMRIWSGKEAEVDGRRHGLYRLGRAGDGGREAQIDIIDARRRLRLIYLPDSSMPPTDSVLVDDFLLDARRGDKMVSLRLLGSGIPESEQWDRPYVKIRNGWERYLSRLKNTLENPPVANPKMVARERPLRGLD